MKSINARGLIPKAFGTSGMTVLLSESAEAEALGVLINSWLREWWAGAADIPSVGLSSGDFHFEPLAEGMGHLLQS